MKVNVPTKKIRKVRDHWHYTGKNKVYHFVKKELAQKFKKQFTCLGENTEK